MPCYNNAKYVSESIQSVLTQTWQDFELLIIDDASTDSSVSVVESISDDRIRLVKNKKNRGISAVRNQLLALAQGFYLTSLDSDDVYRTDEKLACELDLLRLSETGARQSIVYSDIELIDATGHPISRASETSPAREGVLFQSILDRTIMIPRDFLVSASLARGVGGFDENLAIYEDWDYKLRLAQHANFIYTNRIGIGYRRHGTGLSSATKQVHQRCREVIRQKYSIHGFDKKPFDWLRNVGVGLGIQIRAKAA